MPTLLWENGFRFFFYSNENDEPCHIHIEKGNANAKYWLMPIEHFAYAHNFNSKELSFIETIILDNKESFIKKWNGYFNK
jgi:Domain of unknown function (DUF4160)